MRRILQLALLAPILSTVPAFAHSEMHQHATTPAKGTPVATAFGRPAIPRK